MNNSNINIFLSYFQKTFFILLIFFLKINIYALDLSGFKAEIEKNYYSFDTAKHNNIINLLERKKIKNDIIHYYLAFEYHILGKIIYNHNSSLAFLYFDKSIANIEQAISKIESENKDLLSEFYAIYSSALGKKSSLSGISAFYWGIKSQNAFDSAFKLDSLNAKVRLIGAIHLMHVPEILGGDKEKAKKVLINLLKYRRITSNKNEIIWADKAEIYAYLAQIDILKGANQSKYIDSAYKYQPNYDFIKLDLLKQVKK
jgi:hypothetical protein